jgi:hypothetical protein
METNTIDQSMSSAPTTVPNSTAVLVLGILSIVTCWCWGIIGLTLGIIALVLANKGNNIYKANPSEYTEGSYKNLSAGKICAIIGTSLSGLYFLFIIVYFLFIGAALGTAFSLIPWQNWK